MKRRPAIEAHVIDGWRNRRRAIRWRFARDPHASSAWLWRIRLAILEFMLRRYAPDLDVDASPPVPAPDARPRSRERAQRRTVLPRVQLPPAALTRPLQRAELEPWRLSRLRTCAASLAATNDDRHAALEAESRVALHRDAWRIRLELLRNVLDIAPRSVRDGVTNEIAWRRFARTHECTWPEWADIVARVLEIPVDWIIPYERLSKTIVRSLGDGVPA